MTLIEFETESETTEATNPIKALLRSFSPLAYGSGIIELNLLKVKNQG
jgi:hypothetical protein